MVPDNLKDSDINTCCYSCMSTYGCLNCDGCQWNKYNPGIEDKYQLSQLFLNTESPVATLRGSLDIKPTNLEINVPEYIESIVINFKKGNNN